MLYKQNTEDKLSPKLFENPTSEYRGAPFWAWNCELEKDELLRQLDVMQQMGFGGVHMHVRTGMATPYLSDEFHALIRACVDHSEKNGMLAWLYDEDRWPSGAAGGLVTKDERFRQRYLLFTSRSYAEDAGSASEHSASAEATRSGNGRLLARFDVELDEAGALSSYRLLGEEEPAEHQEWFAYLETPSPSAWYNGQTYVNTLDKAAIDRFIELTYESYLKSVGDAFGKTVPAIFTDEPQFTRKTALPFALSRRDVTLPWTDDLEKTFTAAYGEPLLPHIPELIWELKEGVSITRYRYHDHIAERFTEAFADKCGKWCDEHGLALTGHMMEEPTLTSQCHALGEAMRSYRGFRIPGIDMLCASFEYTTAKQAQSAVHQYGREGMVSELYGVTGWDFDFRGHKLHGDWQAALGVTVRVPHLSWVSMQGEAKRDYPASINYQSPWFEKYRYVEDHFARINTAMTRGKPAVRVGVIHPIESYWLHWGPAEQTSAIRSRMDEQFSSLANWLLFGSIDFDYISESLLPSLCEEGAAPLRVGEMAYDAILVPACETLRSTTLSRLEAFRAAGGRLIFLGDAPTLVDALPSDRASQLFDASVRIPFNRAAVLSALEPFRSVELRSASGAMTDTLLHQLRDDGDGKWLFIAHATEPYNKDVSTKETVRIRIRGRFIPTEYDTLTGQIRPLAYQHNGDFTELTRDFYDYDSFLCRLDRAPESCPSSRAVAAPSDAGASPIAIPALADYTLGESNVLLLDTAEFSLDGGEFSPETELLRADLALRRTLGWMKPSDTPMVLSHRIQPWALVQRDPEHSVTLRFRISARAAVRGAKLALEQAERASVVFRGKPVTEGPNGYYTDLSIQTIPLPEIPVGESELLVTVPFSERIGLEWCYLLGEFGVELIGRQKTIVPLPNKLGYGDITSQGFPFFSGTCTYRIPFTSHGGEVSVRIPHYRGAVMSILLDGKELGELAYPPYRMELGRPEAGEHLLEIRLYISRQNAFGPLHNADEKLLWLGPPAWRTEGDSWTDEYRLAKEGILSAPAVSELL